MSGLFGYSLLRGPSKMLPLVEARQSRSSNLELGRHLLHSRASAEAWASKRCNLPPRWCACPSRFPPRQKGRGRGLSSASIQSFSLNRGPCPAPLDTDGFQRKFSQPDRVVLPSLGEGYEVVGDDLRDHYDQPTPNLSMRLRMHQPASAVHCRVPIIRVVDYEAEFEPSNAHRSTLSVVNLRPVLPLATDRWSPRGVGQRHSRGNRTAPRHGERGDRKISDRTGSSANVKLVPILKAVAASSA
jgi:hypothetical protein